MRLAPGTYTLLHPATGRHHKVYVHDDGTADTFDAVAGSCRYGVDLDEYVAPAASEPPPAAAGDGPREVLSTAGAQERHGWSVSATRTLGNPPMEAWGRLVDDAVSERRAWGEAYMSGFLPTAGNAAWCAAADDVSARERELMGQCMGAATGGMVFVRMYGGAAMLPQSSPLVARPAVEAQPSPGPCPSPGCYGRKRRERGEVRVHVWACGCSVRPEVDYVWSNVWAGRAQRAERLQEASGYGLSATHPTQEGAIAAWREALAEAQREEDAA